MLYATQRHTKWRSTMNKPCLVLTSVILLLNLGTASKLLSQNVVAPPATEPEPPVICEGSTSEELTRQAWEALPKDTGKALSCTYKTIKKWHAQADAQQTKAVAAGCTTPKPEDIKTYFQSSWALSDVATSLFIQGEALRSQERLREASEAYKTVVDRYSCAFTWDQRGWFWKTADTAKEKLDKIKHK